MVVVVVVVVVVLLLVVLVVFGVVSVSVHLFCILADRRAFFNSLLMQVRSIFPVLPTGGTIVLSK